jgi:hypothetical protein
MDDYFNLDYEPPSSKNGLTNLDDFDSLLEHTLEDNDFSTLGTAQKRTREEADEPEPFEKKAKVDPKKYDLDEELEQLSLEHPLTYKLNTLSHITGQTEISFINNDVSFTITLKNRDQYESGSLKGMLHFSTTQSPDTLSALVTRHTSASSLSRITDIVSVIVSALTK